MKRWVNRGSNTRGLTLLELMVVIVIIGIIGSAVSQVIPFTERRTRDNRRQHELVNMQHVIELYKSDTGFYPPAFAAPGAYAAYCSENDAMAALYTGTVVTNNYIPNVIPTYYEQLPVDPLPGDSSDPNCMALGGFRRSITYVSNGDHYKLIYNCGNEARAIRPDDALADPGRCLGNDCWAWAVSDNINLTTFNLGW